MKKHLFKKSFAFLLPVVAALLVTGVYFAQDLRTKTYDVARAATYSVLTGYAWSDNYGWISFNCLTGGPTGNDICATSNYRVETDTNGILRGYAWSDNYGWISFNENTDCPSTPCRPTLTPTGLTGWARVSSVYFPTNPHAQAGGEDGWIDLSTVGRTGNELTGYGWGGTVSTGWLSFNCLTGGPTGNNICATSNYKVGVVVTTIPDPTLVMTLVPSNSASSSFMNPGGNVTLTWTSTNVDTCTTSGDWTGAKALNGSEVRGPLNVQRLWSYTMVCTNTTYALSATSTRSITVTSSPFCGDYICNNGETTVTCPSDCTTNTQSFKASPVTVKSGQASLLKWNIIAGQNCRVYNDTTSAILATIPNGNQVGQVSTGPITVRTVFSLRCDGGVDIKEPVSIFSLFEF